MQDRPTSDELLSAVEHFLDDLVTNLDGARSFHARVATNVVRLVRRELQQEDELMTAEWSSLDALLGPEERSADRVVLRSALRTRNEALCKRIRSGELDEGAPAEDAFAHVRATIGGKLQISDPALLERSESV